jgi:hypothetical protein
MIRFALRHWTLVAIILILGAWGLFYLPTTPSWAIIQLKRAIDARDGAAAAAYVDFPSVVRSAGYQIVKDKAGDTNVVGEMLGRGAVDMMSAPMAGIAQSWVEHEVNKGAADVQLPAWAALAAVATLHRDEGFASTEFNDRHNRHWIIHLERRDDGRWRIVEVDNIQELLGKVEKEASRTTSNMESTPEPSP